jgi:hypothetical protein
MNKVFGLFISFFILIIFYGFGVNSTSDHPGKTIFIEKKCITCHSVDSEGVTSKAKKKNDLSEIGSTYKADFLSKFLTKQENINNKKHGTAFKGTEDELKSLTSWLETLKK